MSSVESPDFERPEDAEEETIEERMDRIEAENEQLRATVDRLVNDVISELRTSQRKHSDKRMELARRVGEIEDTHESTTQRIQADLNKLEAMVRGEDPTNPRASNYYDSLTLLEKYHEMPEGERADLLSTSQRRGVVIFEHWKEWAVKVEGGWLITTRQTRDKKYGKSEIKSNLRTAMGEDVQSIEVYRAMREVAKLSVTDPDDVEIGEDQYDREHIYGGAFEYHEKVNADANRRFKVLELANPEDITLP